MDVNDRIRQLLQDSGVTDKVAVAGIRGFNKDSGSPGQNDFGIYDDLLAVIHGDEILTFVGNTDPTRTITGRAVLVPGKWQFTRGIHNRTKDPQTHEQYPALIQAAPFTVFRFGTEGFKKGEKHPTEDYGVSLGDSKWTGWFGINIHKSTPTGTGSAGCQTIPTPYWDVFYKKVDAAMTQEGQEKIWYCLSED